MEDLLPQPQGGQPGIAPSQVPKGKAFEYRVIGEGEDRRVYVVTTDPPGEFA
ncbi:hypothetical protein TUM18999_34240 [Pseudomonas tohonis]|uniref:Uncharacterized protein n=1 Tax=Pseudomonas tohonis TaxID=2725477 RepID=A0A6J4E5L6_9PSED|nr:hypothetical protein TUM18999_34240 [Pseudomonas tohonis]GJN56421.1 hypothetical protein TUM20286_61730 [Pseudomonas tohonis]